MNTRTELTLHKVFWVVLCFISLFVTLELGAFQGFESIPGKYDFAKELSTAKKEVQKFSSQDSASSSWAQTWWFCGFRIFLLAAVCLSVLPLVVQRVDFRSRTIATVHSGRSPPRISE
ncbi:MAG: hypothetical protein KDD70_10090 [Bdellovibrionales bacterium]|nr:hypothetical protein [Bdellovibrionales bacterium]